MFLLSVRFWKEKNKTRQILKKKTAIRNLTKKHNASVFQKTIEQRVDFYINFWSIRQTLNQKFHNVSVFE